MIETKNIEIKSELLNIEQLQDYTLNIFLSELECAFSVFHPEQKRFLRLESYSFPTTFNLGKNNDVLLNFFRNNSLLPAGFWGNINIYVTQSKFSIVPNEWFTKDMASDLLSLEHKYEKNTTNIYSQTIGNQTIVYGIEKELETFFEKIYPNKVLKFHPHISKLIDTQFPNYDQVQLHIDKKHLNVVVFKRGSLHLCNSYSYQTIDDILYFSLLVFKELELSNQDTETIFYSNLDDQNLIEQRLKKYIGNVERGKRSENFKFCYNFDELEENQFFNLLH